MRNYFKNLSFFRKLAASILMPLLFLLLTISAPAASFTAADPQIQSDPNLTGGRKVTYCCIWFGSYPQDEVKKEDSAYALLQKQKQWNADGSCTIKGVRYQRIARKDAQVIQNDSSSNGWKGTTWRYFIWQPVKWRILKAADGQALLMADQILDCGSWSSLQTDLCSWSSSELRSRLNGYSQAANGAGRDYSTDSLLQKIFSQTEQNLILSEIRKDSTSLSAAVTDRLWLPDQEEIIASGYGFQAATLKDPARKVAVTDYALARGCRSGFWWLADTDEDGQQVLAVSSTGRILEEGLPSDSAQVGIRPFLRINLSDPLPYHNAGTVSTDGEIAEPEKEKQVITASSYSRKLGAKDFVLKAEASGGGQLSYLSDHPEIASISEAGKVSIKGYGIANIKIHAAETFFYQAADRTVTVTVRPPDGRITSLLSDGPGQIRIRWKKRGDCSGYQIYLSEKEDFSGETFQRFYTAKQNSALITGLTRGTTYYFRQRIFKSVNGTVLYGKWSAVQSVIIK